MQNKLSSKKRYYFGRKPETEHTHDLQWPHLLSSDPGLLLASPESAVLSKGKTSSFCSYSSLPWKRFICQCAVLKQHFALVNRKSSKIKILPCNYRPSCEEQGRECCRKIYLLNKSKTCQFILQVQTHFLKYHIFLHAFPRHFLKTFLLQFWFFFSVLHMVVMQNKQ